MKVREKNPHNCENESKIHQSCRPQFVKKLQCHPACSISDTILPGVGRTIIHGHSNSYGCFQIFFLTFTHLQSIHAKKKTCWGSAETLLPFVLTTCGTTAPSALSHNMEEIRAITTSPAKGSYLQTLPGVRLDDHSRKSAKTTVHTASLSEDTTPSMLEDTYDLSCSILFLS